MVPDSVLILIPPRGKFLFRPDYLPMRPKNVFELTKFVFFLFGARYQNMFFRGTGEPENVPDFQDSEEG